VFAAVEAWTETKTKFEAMALLNEADILRSNPVDANSPMNRRCARPAPSSRWTIRTRQMYLTVGNPIKMSDSATEVRRSPLLGEHR
jgi:formyl-CoA transferase